MFLAIVPFLKLVCIVGFPRSQRWLSIQPLLRERPRLGCRDEMGKKFLFDATLSLALELFDGPLGDIVEFLSAPTPRVQA